MEFWPPFFSDFSCLFFISFSLGLTAELVKLLVKSLLLRLRLATLESEKEEMLHEVRQLRKMGQAGDLPRDLVSSLLLNQ